MASFQPGYQYDVFISYRQKDNQPAQGFGGQGKVDGWVTAFVEALKSELDSTFKEAVSIYFDANPNDGLLETHDVDDSLKDKLKSLIFIPIISQTYCDPKSFAWKNEFMAFRKLAAEDSLGLKIKLQNGNVGSRILPVRIHDLETADRQLIESEIGVLRSVDFIYRSPGVVRPLLAHEEESKANLDHTFYRDQINKVARGIKEIIGSIQQPLIVSDPATKPTSVSPSHQKQIKIFSIALLALGVLSFCLYYFSGLKHNLTEQDNSIAVLPFANLSNDPEQEYFCDGTTEQVISSLARLKDLKVIARTSVMQYKNTTKTIAEIGKELKVSHILESSVRKSGNQIRVTAQLIAVRDESHLWAEDFDNKDVNDIFQIQDAVATKIASSLKRKFFPEEKEKLKSEKPSNPEAYEHYLKGEFIHNQYLARMVNSDFLEAEKEFKKAIQFDSNYATARAGLSNLYDTRSNFATIQDDIVYFRDLSTHVAEEAFRLNPRLPYSLLVQAQNWIHRKQPDIDSAFNYFHRAFDAAPGSGLICSEFGGFYMGLGLYDLTIALDERAREIDPSRAYRYMTLSWVYNWNNEPDKAEENAKIALRLDSSQVTACGILFSISCDRKKFDEAEQWLNKIKTINPERNFSAFEARLLAEKGDREKALALMHDAEIYAILKMRRETLDELEKELWPYPHFQNPHFDFLRDNPRFQHIVSKAKLQHEEYLKKYGQIELSDLTQ